MNDTTILLGVAAAPVITAIVQVLKPVLPARFEPLASLLFGVIWNVGFTVGTYEFGRVTVFLGIVTGLAASGLYSGLQSVRSLAARTNSGGS